MHIFPDLSRSGVPALITIEARRRTQQWVDLFAGARRVRQRQF
jgi:hypothetical protein